MNSLIARIKLWFTPREKMKMIMPWSTLPQRIEVTLVYPRGHREAVKRILREVAQRPTAAIVLPQGWSMHFKSHSY